MRNRDAGLTLVELMITIIVASLVAASTFIFFAGQQRVYETQAKLVNVQQNLNISMEMMIRFVRAAGAGMDGCIRPDSDGIGVDTGAAPPVGPALPLSSAPAQGLRAYIEGEGDVRVPPLWITNGAAGAPDILTVAWGDGTFGTWRDADLGATIPVGQPTAPLTCAAAGPAGAFWANEFVVVLDITPNPLRPAPFFNDRGCTLFRLTQVDVPGGVLAHTTTSTWNPPNDAAGPAMVPFAYSNAANTTGIRHFGTLNWVRFAIRPPADPTGAPALTMERLDQAGPAEVLAEGIVDLQVAYACDRNPNDGLLTEGPVQTADEWVLNTAADPIPLACGRPDAVRISLISRSLTPDTLLSGVATNVKPALEDGVAGAPDQFRYRTHTTTISARN